LFAAWWIIANANLVSYQGGSTEPLHSPERLCDAKRDAEGMRLGLCILHTGSIVEALDDSRASFDGECEMIKPFTVDT
jgi:hypothetical protein